jgi:hypothetical protein
MKAKYALEKGGPKRLEVNWKGNFQEVTLILDGNTLYTANNPAELRAGLQFSIENGSILKVHLAGSSSFARLHIYKDDWPVHTQGMDSAQILGHTYKFTFFIGGVNLIVGLLGILSLHGLPYMPFPALSLAFGIFFLVLAFFVKRKSIIALSIAVAILALDIICSFFFPPPIPRFAFIIATIFRVLVLFTMVLGFSAIADLKQPKPCSEEQNKTGLCDSQNIMRSTDA